MIENPVTPPPKPAMLSPGPATTTAGGFTTPMDSTPITPAPNSRNDTFPARPPPISSTGRVNTSSTPGKLRRMVSVNDVLVDDEIDVQRLVEYFIVVSCHPRWETNPNNNNNNNNSGSGRDTKLPPPTSPMVIKRPVSAGGVVVEEDVPPTTVPMSETKKKIVQSFEFLRRRSATGGTDTSSDVVSHEIRRTESREETAPPQPRCKWTRDGKQGSCSNIRVEESTTHDHTFQPKITSRYPPNDYKDNPLNPMVTQFCFPGGEVIVPSKMYQLPRVHHFVLTNEKGRKVYGTCLTIYEEYHPPADAPWLRQDKVHSEGVGNEIEVSVEAREVTLYIPKTLCILSIWPYLTAFREYLAQLYRLATSTNVMKAPIERYIMNLCVEIPAPPPGAFEVQVNLLDSVIRFWAPPAKLPIAYVALPFQTLFDCLDIENIVLLWYALTLERKVLLLSSQYSILTICSEILCSLLFPMQWSHLYVPLLPRFLCPMLDAPVPYLCGVTRENWLHVQQFVSSETIVVDLDRNSVMFGETTPGMPNVPGKKWTKLVSSLEQTAGHLFWKTRGLEEEHKQHTAHKLSEWSFNRLARRKGNLRWNEKLEVFDHAFNLAFTPDSPNLLNDSSDEHEQSQWDQVQEAFLRFYVAVFKDYRSFLHSPDGEAPASPTPGSRDWISWSQRRSFDTDAFIASQKPEYADFLTELCLTQQFDDFITKKLYNPDLPNVIFFDQSIDAKLNRSRLKLKKVDTPFLQSAKAHKVLKIFKAVEPNRTGLPLRDTKQRGKDGTGKISNDGSNNHYVYKIWPESFEPSNFCRPRPIPSMITAEFDRQASLVYRLKAHNSPAESKKEEIFQLYGCDYDTSPESMAFTVFFFTYSAVIGREWQDYQKKRRELLLSCDTVDEQDEDPAVNNSDKPPGEETANQDGLSKSNTDAFNVGVQAVHSAQDALSDMSAQICDSCQDGQTALSDAVVYVSMNSPACPDYVNTINSQINCQAQYAYDTIAQMTPTFNYLQQPRTGESLLDCDNDVYAEYEEAREVATAQLDLAFEALKTLELRGLISDPDVFKSIMEACGRCGDTQRALELIELMKRNGLAADKEVLSCFMAAFAHDDEGFLSPGKENFLQTPGQSDAYSDFLKKKWAAVAGDSTTATGTISSSDEDGLSDMMSDSGSSLGSSYDAMRPQFGTALFEWLTPHKKTKPKKRKRRKKKKKSQSDELPVTDRLMKQIVLGESLLDFLYPDLVIDMDSDSCPKCSKMMKCNDIVTGWQPCEFQDFTTKCPTCQHRFVPRFSVHTSLATFSGSQGPGTPLYCEFLSPWVLRKELSHIVESEEGIDVMLDPEWRKGTDIRATLWWNLIALCTLYRLPFSFLLQGSFQNRLISPTPGD